MYISLYLKKHLFRVFYVNKGQLQQKIHFLVDFKTGLMCISGRICLKSFNSVVFVRTIILLILKKINNKNHHFQISQVLRDVCHVCDKTEHTGTLIPGYLNNDQSELTNYFIQKMTFYFVAQSSFVVIVTMLNYHLHIVVL